MKDRIAHGLAWESGTKLIVQIASWVSTILVARLVGPSEFGLFATAGLFTVFLQLLGDYGLATAVVTRTQINDSEVRAAFWFNLYLSIALYVLLFAAAPSIASLYSLPILTDIVRLSGLSLIISSIRVVPYSINLRDMNYRFRALAEMAGQLLQAAIVLSMAYAGFGVWSLIVAFIAGQSLTTLIFMIRWHRVGPPCISFAPIADMLKLGTTLTVSRVIAHATTFADIAVISLTLGSRSVGLFSMASQLANLPIDKIASIASRVAFPALARLQDSQDQARRLFLVAHFFLLGITAPVIVGTAAVSQDLVLTVFAKSWSDMAIVLSILCVAALWKVSGVLMNSVIESFRRADFQFSITWMTGAVAIPGFIVGSHWGVVGVAAAWAIITPIAWSRQCYFAMRILAIESGSFVRSLWPIVAALTIMLIAVFASKYLMQRSFDPPVRLAIQVAAGAMAYVLTIAATVPKEYRTHVVSMIALLRTRDSTRGS